jgi:hypothetical protein
MMGIVVHNELMAHNDRLKGLAYVLEEQEELRILARLEAELAEAELVASQKPTKVFTLGKGTNPAARARVWADQWERAEIAGRRAALLRTAIRNGNFIAPEDVTDDDIAF